VIGLKFRWPGSGAAKDKHAQQGLPIRGLRNDVPVSFEEGGAVPGDRIDGVLTEGEGIRIFQIHSPERTTSTSAGST
jgi:(p)ppGpp synthase/HD superfamily hydrolase